MGNGDAKRGSRTKLRVWYLISAVVLTGSIGIYVMASRDHVERRLEKLRRVGYPTSMAEWAEQHRLPEGAENAASLYEEAFTLLDDPPEDVNIPLLGRMRLPDRGVAWPEEMVGDTASFLASNRSCLDRLHAARRIEHCRYKWEYVRSLPSFQEVRQCTRLLELEMRYHARRGDTNGAIASFKAGLHLSESLRNEPLMVAYLTRTSCVTMLLSGLERSLSVASFTDEQLRELDEALTRTTASLDLTAVLIGEQCWAIEMYHDPSLFAREMGNGAVFGLPSVKKRGLLDTLDFLGSYIEASRLPSVQRLARFHEIDDELSRLSFLHFAMKRTGRLENWLMRLNLRDLVHLDLAHAALAIERYRMAMGNVPERLDELVPQYLQRVPIDPFDGQPIRYRSTEPGYLLYSVLEDGQDNSGRQREGINDTNPYDWCFTVAR